LPSTHITDRVSPKALENSQKSATLCGESQESLCEETLLRFSMESLEIIQRLHGESQESLFIETLLRFSTEWIISRDSMENLRRVSSQRLS
jgi:hypothetical protein